MNFLFDLLHIQSGANVQHLRALLVSLVILSWVSLDARAGIIVGSHAEYNGSSSAALPLPNAPQDSPRLPMFDADASADMSTTDQVSTSVPTLVAPLTSFVWNPVVDMETILFPDTDLYISPDGEGLLRPPQSCAC